MHFLALFGFLFLEEKSDCKKTFLLFKAMAQLLTMKRIKALQFDGGEDYDNLNNMLNLFVITRHVSCPHTPK